MCYEWGDMLTEENDEENDNTLEESCGEFSEIGEDINEPIQEEDPLEALELPEEESVTEGTETMLISQEEYERMLEDHDADLVENAILEGRFRVVDDTEESDEPKVYSRFPDMHFSDNEFETENLTDEGIEEVEEIEESDENIDYEGILRGIEQEGLQQGFEDIDIEADEGRLNEAMGEFREDIWEGKSLEEQKEAMENLADYVKEVIHLDNPPAIEYYNRERNGEYGGYNPETNTLSINEYMLYNSEEAADTIAHELWHAHQYECAKNPQNALGYQYQYNFENYISSEMGQEAYENQLVEAEARAFAEQFKERLRG